MKALAAVILGILILCSGTFSVSADTGTSARDAELEEETSVAAETTAASVDDSTRAEIATLLAGDWRAAETAEEKEQRLQAINEATDGMGRLKRGKARSRLEERTSPPPSLMLEFENSTVTIGNPDRRIELELGGAPIEVSESEEKMRMSAKMEDGRLVLIVLGGTSERTTTYRAVEKNLSVEVIMTSDKLTAPVKYVTTYTRMER
jgi:hypothetical protein